MKCGGHRRWSYRYEGAMFNYLQRWIEQLRWQRLRPFEKLADMLALKAQRLAQPEPNLWLSGKQLEMPVLSDSGGEPFLLTRL
jgi:hypothetical protein